MVRYELSLILRAVGRGQPLPPLLRAACEVVLGQGALLRRLENMGERALPYGMFAHGQRFDRGRYLILDIEAPPTSIATIEGKLKNHDDVIRTSVLRTDRH